MTIAQKAPTTLTPNSPGVDAPIPLYHVVPPAGPPETRYREPLHAHLQDAGAVEPHFNLPAGWVAIRDRWAELVGQETPCRKRLITAVVGGQGDLAALAAQSLAEATPTHEATAEVRRAVGAAVYHELARLYQPVAAKVYKQIAGLFDAAAKRRDDHVLDELLPILLAAARLAGADADVAAHATNWLSITLSIDPRKAHRRRIAEAFATPTRWQRIRELGAEIKASADPLAPPWQLPTPIRCIDTDRRLRWHDPLDGPLPKGWQGNIEGWLDATPAFGQH
ncbi:hypothetical protein [Mycobacterium marinum]|uniref:hypothetical protein n=1 Tax=Mycobacterium marinum TaxID=1781 RepID=UPI0035625960